MKEIEPYVETPILTLEQVQEWAKLGRAAMAARKWSDSSLDMEQVRIASYKIDDMRAELRKTPEGWMKIFDALATVFDSLAPKDR
tara:strand:- start:302 stop:556 length:255 start_codon:yes stop_codon:yes gene_type:complete